MTGLLKIRLKPNVVNSDYYSDAYDYGSNLDLEDFYGYYHKILAEDSAGNHLSAFNQFIRRNHRQHFKGIAQTYHIDYDLLTDIKQLSEIHYNKSKIYEVLIDNKDSLEFINQFSTSLYK